MSRMRRLVMTSALILCGSDAFAGQGIGHFSPFGGHRRRCATVCHVAPPPCVLVYVGVAAPEPPPPMDLVVLVEGLPVLKKFVKEEGAPKEEGDL